MSGTTTSTRHIPALDGLRGLAILGVLAFHSGRLPGGFLGVDLFFVLSGFLITSLLLAEHRDTGRIDLIAFWGRRARRLLPALLVMLAAVALVTWLAGDPSMLTRVRADALATLAYVANWREVAGGGSYWDLFAQPSPLDHTWSLAIEEQFYVLWPLLVVALAVLLQAPRRALLATTLALASASALAMIVMHRPLTDPSRVYFGTDTRATAILIGAALAIATVDARPASPRSTNAIGLIAIAVVVAAWLTATGTSGWLYEGGLVALEVAVAFVVWTVVRDESGPLARVLSWRPLRRLGLISYGLYLWHWPIFVALSSERTGLDGFALDGVRIATMLLVATASFWIVEQPIRRGLVTGRRLVALVPAAAAAVGVVVVVTTTGGVTSPVPSASAEPAVVAVDRSRGVDPPPRVLVAGDSTALVAAVEFRHLRRPPDLAISMAARLGCGIAPGRAVSGGIQILSDCDGAGTEYRTALVEHRPELVVLMSGAWEVLDRVVDGRLVRFDSSEGRALLVDAVTARVDQAIASGAGVALLDAPCFAAPPDPRMPTSERNDPARVTAYNHILHDVATARAGRVTVLDYSPVVCRNGRPTDALEDGVHLSETGAAAFWSWLAPELRSLVR